MIGLHPAQIAGAIILAAAIIWTFGRGLRYFRDGNLSLAAALLIPSGIVALVLMLGLAVPIP